MIPKTFLYSPLDVVYWCQFCQFPHTKVSCAFFAMYWCLACEAPCREDSCNTFLRVAQSFENYEEDQAQYEKFWKDVEALNLEHELLTLSNMDFILKEEDQ